MRFAEWERMALRWRFTCFCALYSVKFINRCDTAMYRVSIVDMLSAMACSQVALGKHLDCTPFASNSDFSGEIRI